ncbi:MAG: GNAT family N-acetyltransferase [Evtepia gabavorous]
MEYQIDIRPFQPEDQEALAGVIRRTWQYDRFCGPKTAQRLGRVYLRQCLTQQTFTRVAVVDGVPVGIIRGRTRGPTAAPGPCAGGRPAVLALLATREGRKVARLFSGVERINQALLSRCPQSYPGQVAFFAVDQPRRGMGLGKRLFQAVMDNMRQEGIGTVFLFTDTSCNYGFYEHQGMVRRAEQTQRIWLGQESGEMTFFVYDYTLAG